jgi:hypothetical protein
MDSVSVPQPESETSRWRSIRREHLAVGVLLALPVGVAAVSFWPGHMSADTLAQIEQVRTGEFTNLHAPLLMWIWRPFYLHLGAGPGWVLMAQLLTFVIGTYLVLRAAFRPVGAGAAAALICCFPPVFGMLGYVGRDTWFTALLVLTFGLIVRAGQVRWPGQAAWMGAALVVAWLALASRQNAVPAVAIACILLGGLALSRLSQRGSPLRLASTRSRLTLAAIGLGLLVTIGIVGTQWLANAGIGASDRNAEQYTLIYDLAGLSERERRNLFPPEVLPEGGMSVIDKHWNPDHMLSYQFGSNPPIAHPLLGEPAAKLRDSWLDAVGSHQAEYIDLRVDLFLRQLAITRPAVWVYHPQIDPNPYGYSIKFSEINSVAKDYVEAFANSELEGGWIYSIWAYLLVTIAAALVLIRRSRGWALAAVGALALAALTYQIGLFFSLMQAQSRYEFPIIVVGLLAGLILLRMALDRQRPFSADVGSTGSGGAGPSRRRGS